jgi:tRNA A37 threonylcarbamoyladenosine dehydratase
MDDAEYQARFGGIARLFSVEGLRRLKAARVCVIGVGGVGSWAVEALARSGIGALTLVDADDVCTTNINRQLPALTDTVGRPKVHVLADRVTAIAPMCSVEVVPDFYTQSNAHELLSVNFNFVIDAVDRMSTKAHIIHACRERGLSVLTCGAAGGRRDGTQARIVDLGLAGQDELLRQVRRKLRRDHGWDAGNNRHADEMGVPCVFSPEKPIFPHNDGTCSAEPEPGTSLRMDCASGFGAATFVTGVFGFIAAGEVVQRIAADRP